MWGCGGRFPNGLDRSGSRHFALRNGSYGQPGRDARMSHGLRQTRTPLFEVWRGFSAIPQSAYPISWTVAMTTGALFASSNSLSIDIYWLQ